MKKQWVAGMAAAAVVVATGAMGTSYVVGRQIEAGFQDTATHWSSEGLSIEVVQYERGLLHSSAETLWTYVAVRDTAEDEAVGTDEEDGDNPTAATHEPVQFKATHQISHGPWPWGHAAQLQSRFVPVAGTQPQLVAALQGRPALQWDTTVGWGRSSRHVATSPALEWTADGSTITWGGLQAQWSMPAAHRGMQGTVHLPSLRVQAPASGTLQLADAALHFDLQQPADQQFLTGPWGLTLASLEHQPVEGAGEPLQVRGLSLESTATLANQVVGMTLAARLQSAQAGARVASDMALEMALRNVDAAWLNQMLQARKSESDGRDGLQQLQRSLPQLLARQPGLDIQRLALRTPEGLSEIRASLAYTGNGQQMQTLLQDLQASLHAQLPKPVLAALVSQKIRRDYLEMLDDYDRTYDESMLTEAVQRRVTQRIAEWREAGIVQAQGDAWATQLDYANGKIQLNHQPLDAAEAAAVLGLVGLPY